MWVCVCVCTHFPKRRARFDYIDTEGPCSLAALGKELFELMAAGRLQPSIGLVLPLSGASEAHDALEQRRTTGKILLQVPQ